jgi:hypothetical protein
LSTWSIEHVPAGHVCASNVFLKHDIARLLSTFSRESAASEHTRPLLAAIQSLLPVEQRRNPKLIYKKAKSLRLLI